MNLYRSSKILRETRELVLMSNGSLIPGGMEVSLFGLNRAHVDTGDKLPRDVMLLRVEMVQHALPAL